MTRQHRVRRQIWRTLTAGVSMSLNSVTGAAQLAGLKLLAFRGRLSRLQRTSMRQLGSFPSGATCPSAVDLGLSATHPEEKTCSRHGLPLGRSRRVADAAEHPLPSSRRATAIRVDGQR